MQGRSILWLTLVGAAGAAIAAGTYWDSLAVGVAGAVIGAGVVRLGTLAADRGQRRKEDA